MTVGVDNDDDEDECSETSISPLVLIRAGERCQDASATDVSEAEPLPPLFTV